MFSWYYCMAFLVSQEKGLPLSAQQLILLKINNKITKLWSVKRSFHPPPPPKKRNKFPSINLAHSEIPPYGNIVIFFLFCFFFCFLFFLSFVNLTLTLCLSISFHFIHFACIIVIVSLHVIWRKEVLRNIYDIAWYSGTCIILKQIIHKLSPICKPN